MKKLKVLALILLMIASIIILSTKVEATTGTVNSETVRVREEPNTTSTILTLLDSGEEVEILEEADGWYKIEVTVDGENITGDISASLIDVEETETNDSSQQTSNTTNETVENTETTDSTDTTTEDSNVSEEPTTSVATTNISENSEYTVTQEISIKILPLINSKEIAQITGTIKVTEIINDWCKIENDTEAGWIRVNLLKTSIDTNNDEETSSTTETIETTTYTVIKTGYVSTDSLKVRAEASTSSEMIDSLTKNDEVSIVEELDGWYKILIGDQIGYVSATYISDQKVEETTSRGGTSRTETVSSVSTQSEEEISTNDNVATEETTEETTTATGNEVVEYAMQYLGYSYVSGGSSPSTGFDCSGFTSYVYKHFGVTLYRTSKDQIKNGVAVERSNLQPGDLLVFNGESNTSIGHVGIYIGSGNFIHASNPTGGVKITALSSSYYNTRYVGARRVI